MSEEKLKREIEDLKEDLRHARRALSCAARLLATPTPDYWGPQTRWIDDYSAYVEEVRAHLLNKWGAAG